MMSTTKKQFDERAGREADRFGETIVHQGELLRHPVYTRVLHWGVAIFFILSLISGFAIYSPWLFRFLAPLFGGGPRTRLLHPWFGLLFEFFFFFQFLNWFVPMKWIVAVSYVIHDLAALLMLAGFIIHVYEGTSHQPGTFHSMTNGTVTEKWAWTHHPAWYRAVTGRDPQQAYQREKRHQVERARAMESWEREQDTRENL